MRSQRRKNISVISIIFNIGLLLLLATAFFLAGLALYLRQRPEELAALLTREIEARSGLVCTVHAVGVAFFPKPVLALVDVDIKGERFTLSTPYVTIWPRLASLLRGEFAPGEISLFQARCFVRMEGQAELAPQAPPPSVLPPFMAEGCELVLRNSSLHLEMPQLVLKAEDIDGHVFFASHAPRGEAALGRVLLAPASWPELTVCDVRLELREAFHAMRGHAVGPDGSLRVTGRVDLPGVLAAGVADLAVREHEGQAGIHVQANVQGNVPAQGVDLPLHVRLSARGGYDAVKVEALELRLADTACKLSGLFEQGGKPPVFSGRLEFGAFSLPRYFAFARGFPSGIQHSLDRLNGSLDFRLDAQGLAASNLRCATSHGAIFTGRGGVKASAKPEIFLDVQAASVNLDEEFPESVRRGVTPPRYGHGPLVGAPGSPWHAALQDIGYDIRIRAAQAVAASNPAGDLALRCSPGAGGPLLNFDAGKIFGGQARGSLAVSGGNGAPSRYALKVTARKLALTRMEKLLPVKSPSEGLVSGDADLRWDGPESASLRLGGAFSLRMEEGWLPQGQHMECSGNFSHDGAQAAAAVDELRARLFGCDLTGHLRGKFAKEGFEAQGRIGVKGASLRQSLAKLGMEDPGLNPSLLKGFSGAAAVAVSHGKLVLSELEGRIDQSRFSGSLSGQWDQRPAWQGKVQVDALDLQAYLDTGPALKMPRLWDVKFLRDFDIRGVVEVQRLRLLGMQFRQARGNVRLSGGVLELAPLTANLYGGPLTAQFRLKAGEASDIQASVRANRIDLRSFSDERGMDAVYEGKASVQLELAGTARSGADIPAGLSGGFSFESGSGSMQARKNLRKAGATPTRFQTIVISGPVERGVFRSERLQVDGPTLRARGGGWVNMAEESLDVKLTVSMTGLPEFPVHIFGKLDKPQTEVRAGQALVQAVGKLGSRVADGIETVGSGLLDVVGGMLGAPFKRLK